MNYFDAIPSRHGSGSMKWVDMLEQDPTLTPDVTPFSAADMEFKPAPFIVDAIKQYLDSDTGLLAYYQATDSYYEAVADWSQKRRGLKIEKEWIVVMGSVSASLYASVVAMSKRGDGILLLTPVYSPFYKIINKNGRHSVSCDLVLEDGAYHVDFEDLAQKAKDPNTTMLLLCTPHNPTGKVFTREELERIGRICMENNVFVVADEAHADLIYPNVKFTSYASVCEEFADSSITLSAPSKGFNLAGMENANMFIKNPEVRRHVVEDVRGPRMLGPSTPLGLISTEAAFRHGGEWLDQLMKVILQNRTKLAAYLEKYIPEVVPTNTQATYLLWLDFRKLGMDNETLEKFLKKSAKLYLDEGYEFGPAGSGFERWNIACHWDVLEKALERLRAAVEEWRKTECEKH